MEVTKSFGFLISGIDQLYTDASNVRVKKPGQFPQACFNICFKKTGQTIVLYYYCGCFFETDVTR